MKSGYFICGPITKALPVRSFGMLDNNHPTKKLSGCCVLVFEMKIKQGGFVLSSEFAAGIRATL